MQPGRSSFFSISSKKVALVRLKSYFLSINNKSQTEVLKLLKNVTYLFICLFMFDHNGFCHDAIFSDFSKIEGIEGNRPLQVEEIHRNAVTIALAKFFYLRNRGFDRVWTGYRTHDRVGPKEGRRWFVIPYFRFNFHIESPYDSPFQMYRKDARAQKTEQILRGIEIDFVILVCRTLSWWCFWSKLSDTG